MSLRSTTALLAALALAAPAVAQPGDQPDVMQILKGADAATTAVQAVSYQAKFHAEGDLAKKIAPASGKVIARKPASGLWLFKTGHKAAPVRVEGTAIRPGCQTEVPFDCAVQGKEVFIIDHQREVFLHGQVPVASLPYLPAGHLFMREYVVSRPFSDEVDSQLARHEGTRDIGGVPCDVIYVLYKKGSEARWYFGQEDHLPRGVERLSPNGKTVLLISDLDTSPEISGLTFRPECPQGYDEQERLLSEVDPETLQDYVGVYRIDDKTTREVMVEDRRIFTRRSGYNRLEIFPAGKDKFFYADSFLTLTFFRDEQGKITHHVLDRLFGDEEKAVRTDQNPAVKISTGKPGCRVKVKTKCSTGD